VFAIAAFGAVVLYYATSGLWLLVQKVIEAGHA
jgi:hypothetical protein